MKAPLPKRSPGNHLNLLPVGAATEETPTNQRPIQQGTAFPTANPGASVWEPGVVTLCRDQAPAPWNIADHLYVWMPAASSAGGAWKPTGSGCESLMSNSQARASSRVCACSRP
jgi:hypothetical protein